jgi:lysophospholipase L1-like esterase
MEPARTARNRFERHPRLSLAAITAVLIVAVDLALARLIGPEAFPADIEKSYRVASPVFHHDLKAKASVDEARWGPRVYPIRTNSLGFKDATPRDVPLLPSGRRIVFIGDSFTEGIGTRYQDSFVGIVAGHLEESGTEVLNAAVASYSPVTYFAKIRYWLEERGLAFDDLFVFIDVSDPQDELFTELDARGIVVPVPGSIEFRKWLEFAAEAREAAQGFADTPLRRRWISLERHSLILRALRRLRDALYRPDPDEAAAREWSRALRNRRTLWTVDEALWTEYAQRGTERAIDHMDRLARLARAAGIRLTVAVYPRRVQIYHGDLESRQVGIWREWAATHGVPLLDFFPCFIGREPWREVADRYFIRGDAHWNELGHRLVAAELLRYLEGSSEVCRASN